jgi:hypothetical protein
MSPSDGSPLFVLGETEDDVFDCLGLVPFFGPFGTVRGFRASDESLDQHRVRDVPIEVGQDLLEVRGILLHGLVSLLESFVTLVEFFRG